LLSKKCAAPTALKDLFVSAATKVTPLTGLMLVLGKMPLNSKGKAARWFKELAQQMAAQLPRASARGRHSPG